MSFGRLKILETLVVCNSDTWKTEFQHVLALAT